MEAAVTHSILWALGLFLGVLFLLAIVILLFQIGRKIKQHMEERESQQERINKSTITNFDQLHKIVDSLVVFMEYGKKHIKYSMLESRKLRQYAMDNQLQMIKITEMYEKSILRISAVEDKVAIIDSKIDKINLSKYESIN
jgi:hypothetical protein